MEYHATEGVAKHSFLGCSRQSTCMPQLQPLCSAALVPNVLPRRDEGSGKSCASWNIDTQSGLEPGTSGPQSRVVTIILPMHTKQ